MFLGKWAASHPIPISFIGSRAREVKWAELETPPEDVYVGAEMKPQRKTVLSFWWQNKLLDDFPTLHLSFFKKMISTCYESNSTSLWFNNIFCLKLLRTLLLTWMIARLVILFIWIKVLQYNNYSPTLSIFEQGISSLRFLIPPSIFRCPYTTPCTSRKQLILED